MLELQDIDKRFHRRGPAVLAGVGLRARPSAITVIQGRSGGGKTTLLRIIAGLETAGGGRVRLDGEDITGLPPERRPVGLVFQSLVVYPHLTAAGNVRMAAEAGGLRGRLRADAVEAALAATGLSDLAGRRPGTMSGGQVQRLALARMLARKPRVCLLDEPLAHLDPPARVELRELVARLRDEERIVVMVTHDGGEAMRLADHLAILAPAGSGGGGGGGGGAAAGAGSGPATVVAAGAPADLAVRPSSVAVADATGLDPVNLVSVEVLEAGRAVGAGETAGGGHAAHLGVRPEAVRLDPAGALPGRVLAVRPVPGGTECVVDIAGPRPFRVRLPGGGSASTSASSSAPTPPVVGAIVRLAWPEDAAWWFDAAGLRIG